MLQDSRWGSAARTGGDRGRGTPGDPAEEALTREGLAAAPRQVPRTPTEDWREFKGQDGWEMTEGTRTVRPSQMPPTRASWQQLLPDGVPWTLRTGAGEVKTEQDAPSDRPSAARPAGPSRSEGGRTGRCTDGPAARASCGLEELGPPNRQPRAPGGEEHWVLSFARAPDGRGGGGGRVRPTGRGRERRLRSTAHCHRGHQLPSQL